MDTIYALASARGKAGVAVLRLSGPQAFAACQALCGDVPEVRRAALRVLKYQGEVIDQALVLTFAAPASFTGEDVVEFHLHGSHAIVQRGLSALSQQLGLRLAEAGEFTRRALENGRLDLPQVEGLADLIDAETEAQRRQAMRIFSGSLGKKVGDWRARLIRAAALLEATIDFADEDVPQDVTPEVHDLLAGLMRDLRIELAGARAAERLREGYEIAILGRPNVGKSTLLNAMAGREAAITSEYAGTTRDVIEVRMDLDGLPVTFLDTAGLRETMDPIEELGIGRALDRARQADLRVFLIEPGDDVSTWITPVAGDLVVRAKGDLGASGGLDLVVSGLTGSGVDLLLDAVAKTLAAGAGVSSNLVRVRHRLAAETAIGAMESTLDQIEVGQVELAAEDLRQAVRALDGIVGKVDVETLLGEIFASFCIGK